MRFPFVLRSQHDEVVAVYAQRVDALEKELHRLKDLIFQNAFGVQLHDTLPVQMVPPVETPAPEPERSEDDREHDDEMRRLAAIKRTRPSQLGPAMSQMMQRRAMRMARAVFPKRTVTGQVEPDKASHPSRKLFEQAKREAIR
jgi:hypothetical protein